MKEQIKSELANLSETLENFGYTLNTTLNEASFNVKATSNKIRLVIDYTQEGRRDGYSFYDFNLLVKVNGESFLKIYSERSASNLHEDFSQIELVAKAVLDGNFELELERAFFFWKRCYMTIAAKNRRKPVYLLRVKTNK